jgi:hypothetical protein
MDDLKETIVLGKPLNIYYCYTHKDTELRDELANHLTPLVRSGLITTWYDRDMRAGTDWEQEVKNHLNTADIILFLVSPHFIASDYCYHVEMPLAFKRYNAGKARLLSVILRSVLWEDTPLGTLLVLPTQGKPVTLWPDQDEAFQNIAKGISDLAVDLLAQRAKEHLEAVILETEPNKQLEKNLQTPHNTEHHITMEPVTPINLYLYYDHEDGELLEELETHLSPLKRLKRIITWQDRKIIHGTDGQEEIENHLNTADIILLLVSPHFINTNYLNSSEMHKILERHKTGKARVIAIIMQPVNWEDIYINELPVLPIDGNPIALWHDRDEALRNVVEGISEIVGVLFAQRTKEQLKGKLSKEEEVKSDIQVSVLSQTQDNTERQIASEQMRGLKIFFCYARRDQRLIHEFEKHLATLRLSHLASAWHKRDIQEAVKYKDSIDPWLSKADMILLLVSADFLASDYYDSAEMHLIFEIHKAGKVPVILIVLRPVDWQGSKFDKLPALPINEKPVTTWLNSDEAFQDIIRGIREVAKLILFEKMNGQALSKNSNSVNAERFQEILEAYKQTTLGSDISQSKKHKVIPELKKYDVALSYASEDRSHAETLAHALRLRGVKVFYDQYEASTLWGQNLYTYLADLYQNQARYCVLFLSQHYAIKLWTTREREAAQARAFKEQREYILPIRLDNTEIPGLLPTISYIEWNNHKVDYIVDSIIYKLRYENKK